MTDEEYDALLDKIDGAIDRLFAACEECGLIPVIKMYPVDPDAPENRYGTPTELVEERKTMRPIDADAMRKEICKRCNSSICSGIGKERCGTVVEIDNQPTIDAVPVVRCKDCKYYYRKSHTCTNERNCYRGSGDEYAFSIDCIGIKDPFMTDEECDKWFCADGERKTE